MSPPVAVSPPVTEPLFLADIAHPDVARRAGLVEAGLPAITALLPAESGPEIDEPDLRT